MTEEELQQLAVRVGADLTRTLTDAPHVAYVLVIVDTEADSIRTASSLPDFDTMSVFLHAVARRVGAGSPSEEFHLVAGKKGERE